MRRKFPSLVACGALLFFGTALPACGDVPPPKSPATGTGFGAGFEAASAAGSDAVPGQPADDFEVLADREAAGRCTKCHSIDQKDDRLGVNWSPFAATTLRPVTQFSHEAHFSLGDQDGCLTCHDLTRTSQFAKGFEDYNPDSFASNFKAMTIATCRQCHNAEQAGSDCTTCHNYHVGDFKPTLLTVESLTK